MKSPFVPLSPNSLPKAQKGFVPKVLPPAESSSTAPGEGTNPGTALHAHGGKASAPPTIEVKREGDKVVGIAVRCGCGELIEIELIG